MIGLYCPDIPPTPGGVSDHTLVLARALEAQGAPPAVFARRGDPARFAPLPVRIDLRPGAVAAAARAAGVSHLLLQYVPFLFARRGVAPALVSGMRRLEDAGIRLAVFMHEPFVPFTRLPWLLTGGPQRLQLRALLRGASHVYTAVPHFADIARRYARPDSVVRVAPVGATLPVSPLGRAEARATLGLGDGQVAIGIFSPAASGFAHAWIAAAARRLGDDPRVVWVRFGHGSATALPGYPSGRNVIVAGEGAPDRVAATMRALDIAAAPYVDGLTLRRSSAMLALAHGVPTVSSEGPLFDPDLRALAACEPDPAAFAGRLEELVRDADARARWAAAARGYAGRASVERLATILREDLEPAA